MRNCCKTQSFALTLISFTLISCGTFNPEPIKDLLFHGEYQPTTNEPETEAHAKAQATADLERALVEPDRATASALIRAAIGALR